MNIKTFNFTDKFGNKYRHENGAIHLKVKGEGWWRHIGELTFKKKNDSKESILIFKKQETENGIHRKTNSWSIPYEIFKRVGGVWIVTPMNNYKILTDDIDKKFLHFKESKTELKVYIPLELFAVHN